MNHADDVWYLTYTSEPARHVHGGNGNVSLEGRKAMAEWL